MVNDQDNMIQRGVPDLPDERVQFITDWHRKIKYAKDVFFKKQFKQMCDDMRFVRGFQWDESGDLKDGRYTCNITHRHLQKRVAALYAKNPRAIAERKKRMDFAVWDESQESLMLAQEILATPGNEMNPDYVVAQAIMSDFTQGTLRRKQFDGIAKTLEILYEYYMNEARPRFKLQVKQLVRRTLTCGVGYLKIGFQRDMEPSPDQLARIRDFTAKLDKLQMLAEDLADGEIQSEDPEAVELRMAIESVQREEQMIIREGLMFDYPKSTAIIPDDTTVQLKGFLGASWIAEEYFMTKDEVKQKFEVDLGEDYAGYKTTGERDMISGMSQNKDKGLARIWEVRDLDLGNLYYLCDGYNNFLKQNFEPPITFEQGHPYHVLTFNDIEDDKNIFPPSDIVLLRDQAKEYNRSREALREHRVASRPAWISPKGMWGETDQTKLGNHLAHELMQLNIPVTQNLDINKLLIPKPIATIDPNMYDVEFLFTDVLRATGEQEASFGGSSGDTATEISVAEQARVSSVESNIDDMDDFMTDVARDSGQVLMLNMSMETVKEIVGPGAIWAQISAQDAANEIVLEVQAGSSGRPNTAQELANMDRVLPHLIQMPGLNPTWLLKQVLTRMDDKLDLTEAISEGMPSIITLNAMSKLEQQGAEAQNNGSQEPSSQGIPSQQGEQGANNQPQPPQTVPGSQPAFPGGESGAVQ